MIAFILAVIGVNTLVGKKMNKIGYEYESILSRLSRRYSYICNNMVNFGVAKEVRINGASTWLRKKYRDETNEFIRKKRHQQNMTLPWQLVTMTVDLVQTVVIYGYCANLAINGDITIGSFTVFLGAVTAFTGSFSGFIGRFPGLALLSKYVGDYREFERLAAHAGAEREVISGENPTDGRYDIEFVDVSFKYPNTDRFVLRHVNIKIKAGERLSVVGYNGAGKSTFIKLICRLYEPTEGEIFVNGIRAADIPLSEYYQLLGVVFQDFSLFGFSVNENIAMDTEFDDARIESCIKKCGLEKRMETLPHGRETCILKSFDPDGIELSGGEGQKIAIARAVYRDAPIVVFDEPTSAIDPIAEYDIYKNFHDLAESRTAIYISHRLSSTRFTDKTAVFANNRIAEYGKHDELMQIDGGVYRDMFAMQAKYYQD